ncbi:TetR/AcrR family transcriptional regulator [Hydrogenibacillus schlegelii]|uniref:TetR/AcrR family transcriptional regulator n=1 Tax=Hydrogenibacillus schlegelii TaxID=1484 RepID=UPI002355E3B5|nr:TetR/AcrR family transcriptional regulator [Hydrogenibacillus schlegelii]
MKTRPPELPWDPARGKRDAILLSAYNTFADFGYANTKIETIAERAGVGKGTVYLYFKNKGDLFRRMIQELIEWHLTLLREQMAGPRSALERLRALFQVHLELIAGRKYPLNPHGREIGHVDEELRAWLRDETQRFLADLRRLIEEGIAEGVFRAVTPALAALWLFATLGVTFSLEEPLSARQVEELVDLVERGLRAR